VAAGTPARGGSEQDAYDPTALAFALRRAWYYLMHGLDQGPPVAGLQVHQFWVLGALDRGPRTMGDLSRVTSTTQANTTGMIGRLEKRGLVVRSHSEADRRLVEVSLTDEGRAAISEHRHAVAARLDDITRGMTDDERAQLEALLREVVKPGS
jgi:DNA-binding MarR family transcriptional regulator